MASRVKMTLMTMEECWKVGAVVLARLLSRSEQHEKQMGGQAFIGGLCLSSISPESYTYRIAKN
jgi:hypothetical protein